MVFLRIHLFQDNLQIRLSIGSPILIRNRVTLLGMPHVLCNFSTFVDVWNGEILLKFENQVVLYHLKDGKFRNPEIPNMCNCLPMDTYVEGLVSLDGNNLGYRQEQYQKLEKVDEVEETKLLLRMVPIAATFLLYGVIKSNRFAISAVKPLYRMVFEQRIERMNGRYSSGMKVGLGMLTALACCKVAWLVEYIRLKSLKEHSLVGHPDAIAPISIFWLSPQFVQMGIMDGLARDGMEDFLKYQVPESMRKRYVLVLTEVVIGWGKILNIGFIMILDVVLEKLRVEDGSWIADTVNQSRLDLFYAALVV
ncbi:protein NRT1/ PTR FAMILY 5.10-like [Camellia sinensis]|uniref:protein NRT1/ PTR FAMILY 5.10-like n=1 Tax=Camellia sinensis TaxID=4442 RepID=UPI001035E2D8|nr:protein NRT1/ PTR FAMILY 5.10-like [Camellia sinensis]